jgi:hypothetical protein
VEEKTETSEPVAEKKNKTLKYIFEFIVYGVLFVAIADYVSVWVAIGLFAGLAFFKK